MSDDLIKRSDAIKAVSKVDDYGDGIGFEVRSHCLVELELVPSADRPQEDFVSKRYLLAEIDDLADEFSEVDENGLHGERWCGILDSKGIIVNAPSVSDRPQGAGIRDRYWSRGVGMGEDYGFFYKCSLCEYEVENGYTRCGFNFCPYCGCAMTKE